MDWYEVKESIYDFLDNKYGLASHEMTVFMSKIEDLIADMEEYDFDD